MHASGRDLWLWSSSCSVHRPGAVQVLLIYESLWLELILYYKPLPNHISSGIVSLYTMRKAPIRRRQQRAVSPSLASSDLQRQPDSYTSSSTVSPGRKRKKMKLFSYFIKTPPIQVQRGGLIVSKGDEWEIWDEAWDSDPAGHPLQLHTSRGGTSQQGGLQQGRLKLCQEEEMKTASGGLPLNDDYGYGRTKYPFYWTPSKESSMNLF